MRDRGQMQRTAAVIGQERAARLDALERASPEWRPWVELLRACGRQLQTHIPSGWSRGYCPVCGAWPVLAELRGLERTRCLRCGRCGVDWQRPWLACVYCS